MLLSHRIQLSPTPTQEVFLRKCVGVARATWNWALDQCQKHWADHKKHLDPIKLKLQWNQIKKVERPWVYEVPKDCNQNPFWNLKDAYSRYFKACQTKNSRKVGLPKFKKLGVHDSFSLSNDQALLEGQKLWVPKLGWVSMTETLRWQGKVVSYTISRQAHKWFVSVQVDVGEYRRPRTGHNVLGVDLGLTHLAVTSEGEVFDNPKPLKKNLKRLKRLSRVVSRRLKVESEGKKTDSSNRAKARMALANMHMRIGNIRKDALHKVTSKLIRENQTVVMEDLGVSGMLKNRRLARAISDVGWYEFRRQMGYKAIIYGTELIFADRFYPSSKLCSVCGEKQSEMPLSIREWECACGTVHDRDLNAAINLRTLGFRETLGAQELLSGSNLESSRTLVDRGASGLVFDQTKFAG